MKKDIIDLSRYKVFSYKMDEKEIQIKILYKDFVGIPFIRARIPCDAIIAIQGHLIPCMLTSAYFDERLGAYIMNYTKE